MYIATKYLKQGDKQGHHQFGFSWHFLIVEWSVSFPIVEYDRAALGNKNEETCTKHNPKE